MTLPILSDEEIPIFTDISEIHSTLHSRGCRRCDLGFQSKINGCCVSRGTFSTNKMIIGEAPGKEEDSQGKPFTGPAGRLMDEIWSSVGLNTNDWYITNVVKCRPVAEKGSGKENFTPKLEQRTRCKFFIDEEIRLLNPDIIVTVGAIATAYITGKSSVKMGELRGKPIRHTSFIDKDPDRIIFPMLHPAAILHAKSDPNKYALYKQQMWEDIQKLKSILEEANLL